MYNGQMGKEKVAWYSLGGYLVENGVKNWLFVAELYPPFQVELQWWRRKYLTHSGMNLF